MREEKKKLLSDREEECEIKAAQISNAIYSASLACFYAGDKPFETGTISSCLELLYDVTGELYGTLQDIATEIRDMEDKKLIRQQA